MDTRTGQIFNSREEAIAAGVPENYLVTGKREALEDLQRRLQLPKHKPFGRIRNAEPKRGDHG